MEGPGTDEHRMSQHALARIHRRRRLTALGVLLAIGVLVIMSLNRSAPAGTPPLPTAITPPPAQPPPPPRSALAAQAALDDKAIDDVLAYTPYIQRASRRSKDIALTFDDGPGPTTPALMRYLIANNVHATFFLVGKAIGERPMIVRQLHEAGFTLGAHTETHSRLRSMTAVEQGREILGSADRITRITGHAVKLFRPPYGSFDATTLGILRAERMLLSLWSVDTRDYSARSAKPIVYTGISGARAGAVVLMHDGPEARPHTLAAVRKIVPALRKRGYRLVTLPELLRKDPPPRNQPAPRSLAG